MNPRSALLVTLLAAGFVYQPAPTGQTSRAKDRPQTLAAAGSAVVYEKQLEVEDWPRVKLHEFFTTRAIAKLAAKDEAARCPLQGSTPVQFLVANVPDPQNSHYPVMFDRFVESIKRAAED